MNCMRNSYPGYAEVCIILDRVYHLDFDRTFICVVFFVGNPSQVIRYNRWPSEEDINCSAGPLPISSDSIVSKCSYRLSTEPSTEAPVFYRRDDPKHYAACMICRVCGSELQFEFQVMPQILYYLGVDRQTDVIRPHESQSVDARDHISASLPEELFHNPTEEVNL